MELAAAGTWDLGDAASLLFRRFHRIELQLFTLVAEVDVHGQRPGQQVVPRAEEPAKLPLLDALLSHMSHLPAAAEAGLSLQVIHSLSRRQKRPLSLRTEGVKLRGTTSGSPLPRESGLMGCHHTPAR